MPVTCFGAQGASKCPRCFSQAIPRKGKGPAGPVMLMSEVAQPRPSQPQLQQAADCAGSNGFVGYDLHDVEKGEVATLRDL